MNELPDELSLHVYKFLNPISKAKPYLKSHLWCNCCGEFLKNGDWISLFSPMDYMDYFCYHCNHLNKIHDINKINDMFNYAIFNDS